MSVLVLISVHIYLLDNTSILAIYDRFFPPFPSFLLASEVKKMVGNLNCIASYHFRRKVSHVDPTAQFYQTTIYDEQICRIYIVGPTY